MVISKYSNDIMSTVRATLRVYNLCMTGNYRSHVSHTSKREKYNKATGLALLHPYRVHG